MKIDHTSIPNIWNGMDGPPNPMASVPTFFCLPKSFFAAYVPFPLLVLDGISWTLSLTSRVLERAKDLGNQGLLRDEDELVEAAANMIAWLDFPLRTCKVYAPLGLRQAELYWPSVTGEDFGDYAGHLKQRCHPAPLSEAKVAMTYMGQEIRVHATSEFVLLLAFSGVESWKCERSKEDLDLLIRTVSRRSPW